MWWGVVCCGFLRVGEGGGRDGELDCRLQWLYATRLRMAHIG